jgi:putative ABC transport system ATP-binding protein
MSDSIIRLTDVTKVYGSGLRTTPALQSLSLDIRRGQFVSLMGPSGSGKTTLLNLIAGLDAPDSGQIHVDGDNLAELPDHRRADIRLRKLGFIFQAFNLVPALTVCENVRWPLEFAGCSRMEARTRAKEALDRVGVHGRDTRYPGELSGGEQQRVAIARAIATSPKILLADEPTGNLDSHTGQGILDLIRTLNDAQHVTVLMVTHNAFAATYGDRTLEIKDGQIARDVRTPPRGHLGLVKGAGDA